MAKAGTEDQSATLDNILKTALDDAAKNKNIENYEDIQKNNLAIIKSLLEKGTKCFFSSFKRAVLENNSEVVRLLVNETRNSKHVKELVTDANIFIDAWKKGVSNEILDELVRHGANVNYHDSNQKRTQVPNLLHDSLNHQEVEKAKRLLHYGADMFLPNKEGVTPEDLIRGLNNEELNKIFESQKAQVAESLTLMKEIKSLGTVPAKSNDEQLNKLMFFLEHQTLTYPIQKEYNFQGEYAGRKKANVIIDTVQGIINKYQNVKKRAAQIKDKAQAIAGNVLKQAPSGALNSPTPSPSRSPSPGRSNPSTSR